jgi:hypothetical protein
MCAVCCLKRGAETSLESGRQPREGTAITMITSLAITTAADLHDMADTNVSVRRGNDLGTAEKVHHGV